jgi:hypothetical protein
VILRYALPVILLAAYAACRAPEPAGGNAGKHAMPSSGDVVRRHTDSLMAIPGVVGVGQGERNGHPTVYVMVARLTDSLRRALPDSLEGYAVQIVTTGTIQAQPE